MRTEWIEEYERKHGSGKGREIAERLNNNDKRDIISTKEKLVMLENQRYGRNKETLINNTYINSGEYRNKFDKITENKNVARVLYSTAKDMLQHRSGTLIEDMFWIDGNTGNVICKVVDETAEQVIKYSESILKAIKGKRDIITLHTHPSSMPPSVEDFNSSFSHNYKKSLIICHDGTIYSYNASQRIEPRLWELYAQEYFDDGMDEKEAQLKALEKIKGNHDIYFEEVK